MTQPTKYVQLNDFSDELTTTAVPGTHGLHLDQDLQRVKSTTDQIIDNLAVIQRDDTALRNASVHPDAFSAASLALIGAGSTDNLNWTPRGAWVTATVYAVGDVVETSGSSYVSALAHTSGTFATDYAAGKWVVIDSNLRRVVSTISALKGLAIPATDMSVFVLGYYAALDLGGGHYIWSSADTTADNGGTCIQPTSAPAAGRWRLKHNGTWTVGQFGAKGDGTGTDHTYCNNAITAANTAGGGEVFFPPPSVSYRTTSAIVQKAKVRLTGNGKGSIINAVHAGNAIEMFSSQVDVGEVNCGVSGLTIITTGGERGIYVKDSAHWYASGNDIRGFSRAGIETGGTFPTGGCFCVNVFDNRLMANGRGLIVGADTNVNNNITIIGNRCQGSTVGAGICISGIFIGLTIVGNDVEGNSGVEIDIGSGGSGFICTGNYSESSGVTTNWMRVNTDDTTSGWIISGNSVGNSAAGTVLASAIAWTSTVNPAALNVKVENNTFTGWAMSGSPGVIALPVGGVEFPGCDFNDNYWGASPVPYITGGFLQRELSSYALDVGDVFLKLYNNTGGANDFDIRQPALNEISFKNVTTGNEPLRIRAGDSLSIGLPSLATTATDGFVYVPSCAGTPTGVPTAIAGFVPIVVNTTANKLYFYSTGAWRDAGP
jgi:hypothetical protein